MRIVAVLLTILLAGCVAPDEGLLAPERNVHFYVSNQSFDQPTAHVRISVDGVVLFEEDLHVEDQHNWESFDARLEVGHHRLVATETTSKAQYEGSLDVEDEHWVVVDYWTGPPRFSASFHDQPVAFD